MPEGMKKLVRGSISDEFEVLDECPIPCTPNKGARVKVMYAGACYTDKQVKKSGQRRLRIPGVQDTSLFPGYEVSGVIDQICPASDGPPLQKGDRVVLYPDDDNESCIKDGSFAEFITTSNPKNLIRVPDSLPLDVAAQLPSGALMSYAAIIRAKPFIRVKSQDKVTNLLIVGAGVLGRWTIRLAKHFLGNSPNIKITVADTCLDKLNLAKDCGCTDTIHWNDSIHEEQMLERTRDACQGGVDIIFDFVSTPRSIGRAMKLLNEEGVILVGGTANYDVSFCLSTLAQKNHSIIGVRHGTRAQLQELVDAFDNGLTSPTKYTVYPVSEANKVFKELTECKISGRAVLQVSPEA